MNVSVGTLLRSKHPRDAGRTVKVVAVAGDLYTVENTKTQRRTNVFETTLRKSYEVVERQTKPAVAKAIVTTERQRELLRIIKAKFSDFSKRQQHYYLGGGMSTSHVVVAVIADIQALHAFWPSELVKKQWGGIGTTSYVLQDDTLYRVQNRVRDVLDELQGKGLLEKVGNKDERRWKPTYAA